MNKGRLEFHTYPEGAEWNEKTKEHMVMWNTREFPANFLLEFDVSSIDPTKGLAIVFLSATGLDGKNALQWSDPDENVYDAGRIGLRNMGGSHIVSYGHFKVWEVSPK